MTTGYDDSNPVIRKQRLIEMAEKVTGPILAKGKQTAERLQASNVVPDNLFAVSIGDRVSRAREQWSHLADTDWVLTGQLHMVMQAYIAAVESAPLDREALSAANTFRERLDLPSLQLT